MGVDTWMYFPYRNQDGESKTGIFLFAALLEKPNSSRRKINVSRKTLAFPFGARPIFRGIWLVSGRVTHFLSLGVVKIPG